MASLELDSASGWYRVRFRYAGREYKRSLKTKRQRVAQAGVGQVEETLRMLALGLSKVPPEADPGDFILTGARVKRTKAPESPTRTLADLFRVYQEELPAGAKEEATLQGERIHFKHLTRHLKAATRTASLTAGKVQRYVELRSKDLHHGQFIGPDTIKKEITTLRLVWNWAVGKGYLDTRAPVDGLVFPKRDEKPPFMTMVEIERAITRGGSADLWESLYLTGQEVDRLLDFVVGQKRGSFVYPMFVLAAHTGMRRSELLRAERSDFDFDGRTISIREKKRSRKHALSYRRVPMTARVKRVFQDYFEIVADGAYALMRDGSPITQHVATNQFKSTLRGSVWKNVKGFHVLRHSFASNAASEGVDQRMIDEWMGHQTEEMTRRYRHLASDKQRAAIDTVFDKPVA